MTITTALPTIVEDADLVGESLSGNRDAFSTIVTRYQSLICSLAYSATGSLGQSEDLAQETFITAWKHLGHLRERNKLRAWLCGIARNRINNSLRREGRNPIRDAEPLEEISESHSPEPLPVEHTISKEEESILWRSLERIPESYREPLILFYREHQSIETVAANLDLSEDTVKQRLSRGRKMLQEQVLAFIEGALTRTSPGKAFTIGVLAALPAMSFSAKAAVVGAAAVKGTTAVKATAASSIFSVILGPLLVLFGNYASYRMNLEAATSDRERKYIKSFYRWLSGCIVVFMLLASLLISGAMFAAERYQSIFIRSIIALVVAYTGAIVWFSVWASKERREILREGGAAFSTKEKPIWEYRSKLELFGLPLVHIRLGGGIRGQRNVVKAWIAAGDYARGLLLAFGGVAVAPIAIGGVAIGLVPFGGCALGLLSLGGLSVGIWSWGGLAIGLWAIGGCALAWKAAVGGAAIAREFALGPFAHAAAANTNSAKEMFEHNLFFNCAAKLGGHVIWLNLIWVLPLVVAWNKAKQQKQEAM